MNNKNFICLVFCLGLIVIGCSKDNPMSREQGSDLSNASGATQISGVGFFDATDECNSAGQGAAYSINMTGDIEGCLYTFVDDFECSPGGTYREEGRELSLSHPVTYIPQRQRHSPVLQKSRKGSLTGCVGDDKIH